MAEKRDPTKEYESKEILPEKETDYFGWLESWFSSHNLSVHNCLQTCHSFETILTCPLIHCDTFGLSFLIY